MILCNKKEIPVARWGEGNLSWGLERWELIGKKMGSFSMKSLNEKRTELHDLNDYVVSCFFTICGLRPKIQFLLCFHLLPRLQEGSAPLHDSLLCPKSIRSSEHATLRPYPIADI